MSEQIDYRSEVKRMLPSATAELHGSGCCICEEPVGDVVGHSYIDFSTAWKDAYFTLKKQGKL